MVVSLADTTYTVIFGVSWGLIALVIMVAVALILVRPRHRSINIYVY